MCGVVRYMNSADKQKTCNLLPGAAYSSQIEVSGAGWEANFTATDDEGHVLRNVALQSAPATGRRLQTTSTTKQTVLLDVPQDKYVLDELPVLPTPVQCRPSEAPDAAGLLCTCVSGHARIGEPLTVAATEEAQRSCEPCPDGSEPDNAGGGDALRCVPCIASISNVNTGHICTPCAAGSSPSEGKDACNICPAGTYRCFTYAPLLYIVAQTQFYLCLCYTMNHAMRI
eukprot:COSAG05_NODE_2025_length_3676_cov_2.492715_3_plen_228_part_00